MIERKNKLLKYFTLFFLFSMPVFDTIWFYSKWTTFVRVVCIFIIFILTFFIYKESRKKSIYLFLWMLLCGVYFVISYYHVFDFFSLQPKCFYYSGYEELLTILKIVCMPPLLFSLYFQKLTKKEYFFVVKGWILIICGSIILSNLFKISLSSYGVNTISYNIFEWRKGLYYVYTASRGFFVYANQVAVYLIILLVLSFYMCIYHGIKNVFYLAILSLSMLMLGSRVSSLGGLIVLIFLILSYVVFTILKKEKFNFKVLYILIVPFIWGTILFTVSPYLNRNVELDLVYEIENKDELQEIGEVEESKIDNNDSFEYVNYVDENVDNDYIPRVFYQDYYDYNYDYEFWYDFIISTPKDKLSYRYIQFSIIKRVVKIDDRWTDYLWGISNVRIQNIMNIERDFVLHFYAFGIVGSLILLLYYPLSLIYSIVNFWKNKNYFNLISLYNICLFILIAFLSGNILNSINMIVLYAFIFSMCFLKE